MTKPEVLASPLSLSVICETNLSKIMTQLSKVCILELSTRVYPNVSWLEEYRKTVEVDGEQTWVGVILALEAELFAYPADRSSFLR